MVWPQQMLVGIGLVLLESCVCPHHGGTQTIRSPAPVHSAPLHLRLSPLQGPSPISFVIDFSNVGKNPLILSLGFTLGKEYASAVHFLLTDAQGKTLRLDLWRPDYFGGIESPYVVHLSAGSSYELRIELDDYIVHHNAHENVVRVSDLQCGPYSIKAEYTGLDAFLQPVDHPTKRTALTPYWTGTVVSNTEAITLTQTLGRRGG
jgi:hypothetical protein